MYNGYRKGGRLAQLGERCVRNAEVGGSNPLSSTILIIRDWKYKVTVQEVTN